MALTITVTKHDGTDIPNNILFRSLLNNLSVYKIRITNTDTVNPVHLLFGANNIGIAYTVANSVVKVPFTMSSEVYQTCTPGSDGIVTTGELTDVVTTSSDFTVSANGYKDLYWVVDPELSDTRYKELLNNSNFSYADGISFYYTLDAATAYNDEYILCQSTFYSVIGDNPTYTYYRNFFNIVWKNFLLTLDSQNRSRVNIILEKYSVSDLTTPINTTTIASAITNEGNYGCIPFSTFAGVTPTTHLYKIRIEDTLNPTMNFIRSSDFIYIYSNLSSYYNALGVADEANVSPEVTMIPTRLKIEKGIEASDAVVVGQFEAGKGIKLTKRPNISSDFKSNNIIVEAVGCGYCELITYTFGEATGVISTLIPNKGISYTKTHTLADGQGIDFTDPTFKYRFILFPTYYTASDGSKIALEVMYEADTSTERNIKIYIMDATACPIPEGTEIQILFETICCDDE